ncbi:MAG: hypothetical protein KDJ35_03125 [Alphaproteobacteria bacterium]|nr:hypothetical protein [Alphaproteobacteria bacterium]
MMQNIKNQNRVSESGNVLFLILIAVALFAALSYAVTQSTRTGGGSGDNETALISSAQLTQYPATVRTSVVRMIIGGTDIGNLEFNDPSEFSNLGSNPVGVFHPSGGGATYSSAPGEMMDDGNPGTWVFNAENEIYYLGTTNEAAPGTPLSTTADVIAFLPGITETLCSRINTELGISGIPVETGIDVVTNLVNTDGTDSGHTDFCDGGCGATIGQDVATLDAQPFGCFELVASSGNYVYFHVLVER